MSRVPMIDLAARDADEEAELHEAFARVLRSGRYILGPEVEAFEKECAAYLGVGHAIGVSSGTDALLVSLMALGIGPGDEVVCPAYSFFATAEVIVRVGATPVFADIDAATYCIDPADVERVITARTKALLPVHLFGLCAETRALRELARRRGLAVIEDAAQAFGAEDEGKKAGGLGTMGCFSFFPTKNLGGFGDGGMVTTDDAELARRVRRLRNHGAEEKNRHVAIGGNFRLDALQAALLRVKLRRVDAGLARRREVAREYDGAVRAAGGELVAPAARPGATYGQYVLRARGGRAARLRESLEARGIESASYYPTVMSAQPCLGHLTRRATPEAEALVREHVALPIGGAMTRERIRAVVEALRASAC